VDSEAGRHARALRDAPGFTDHLVAQVHGRYPVRDGRFLMFLEFAGGPRDTVTIADLPAERLTEACRDAIDLVLTEWNSLGSPTPATATATVRDYLGLELRHALDRGEQARRWLEEAGVYDDPSGWISLGDSSHRQPNPLGLLHSNEEIDYLGG